MRALKKLLHAVIDEQEKPPSPLTKDELKDAIDELVEVLDSLPRIATALEKRYEQ